jgi:hypothetical protein
MQSSGTSIEMSTVLCCARWSSMSTLEIRSGSRVVSKLVEGGFSL